MINVDFMLGQRHRRLTYINPPLSIPQHKHDRSTPATPAQCFPNVEPLSQTIDQHYTNIGSVCRADRDCTPVITMTPRWVYVNPQSEMMSQHPTKSGCYNHWKYCWYLVLTQKQVYNNTYKRCRSNVALMLGRHCIGWTNSTTQLDCM